MGANPARQFRYDIAHQHIILGIPAALLIEAELHTLRGHDAVQLAAGVGLHRARRAGGLAPLTLVSSDGDLNTSALAEGLIVDNPISHP